MRAISPTNLHRLFYPVVPVIVTTGFQGRTGAMPAIWCMPLSFTPALIGVSIAPEHETFQLVKSSRLFGLNWLTFKYADRIAFLGETSAKAHLDKVEAAGLTFREGNTRNLPLIKEAVATVECKLNSTFRFGTHELVVGEATDAAADDDFDEYWRFENYSPILYCGTGNHGNPVWKFRSLASEISFVRRKT